MQIWTFCVSVDYESIDYYDYEAVSGGDTLWKEYRFYMQDVAHNLKKSAS